MRIAQVARLAQTTVRTVRYYHSLGLLPVPAERGGWRDYDVTHLARLSRIRWLAQAGVPLGTIARILDAPPDEAVPQAGADHEDPVSRDLAAALVSVQAHLDEVTAQRDLLVDLLQRSQAGLSVSPMTPRMSAFFDRMEAAAPDERTRAEVRADRDAVDLACYRRQMPPEAEVLFPDPDPDADANLLEVFGRAATGLSDQQIELQARDHVRRITDRLEPDRLRALARAVDRDAVRAIFQFFASLEPADLRYAHALERCLMEVIESWSGA